MLRISIDLSLHKDHSDHNCSNNYYSNNCCNNPNDHSTNNHSNHHRYINSDGYTTDIDHYGNSNVY